MWPSLQTNVVGFAINLACTVLGIWIVLRLESHKRPRLSMTIGSSNQRGGMGDAFGRQLHKVIRVSVKNERMPRCLGGFWDRETAVCHAWVKFPGLEHEMRAWWAKMPVPDLHMLKRPDGTTHMWLSGGQEPVHIGPGEHAQITVAIKVDGDDECYGFTRDSHRYVYETYRHPSWRVESGRHPIRVRVATGGRQFSRSFLLVNESYEGFGLEPIGDESAIRLGQVG